MEQPKFEDIAKMPIDIELLNLRIGRSMRRHGTIGGLIRIIRFIKAMNFCVCLKLLDDPVSILGIIFGNKCFNAGRIKDGHIRFCRVNRLTDRLGNVNKVIENELQVIPKILFEPCDFGSIRDFGKTTEFTEWFRISEKSQEKLICRDRENTLNDQSPQKSLQGVFTGSARRCIEMISERNRNKLINIDMGFQ